MPLSKSKGNMYPWVTHTHTHLKGTCPHKCTYCYVQAIAKRFNQPRYTGELGIVEKEFDVNYGAGRTIFIEHCNDLWADAVPDEWIARVLEHCREFPDNTYVFQTKNPTRYGNWYESLPPKRILGCTVETDAEDVIQRFSDAPSSASRIAIMRDLSEIGETTFITVEPILECLGERFADSLAYAKPAFVNIGADSKGTGLDEPHPSEVRDLIDGLSKHGIEIRQKSNLARLLKQE